MVGEWSRSYTVVKGEYGRVVKQRNTSESKVHTMPLCHYPDSGSVDHSQHTSLGEYCDSHTASSECLIIIMCFK